MQPLTCLNFPTVACLSIHKLNGDKCYKIQDNPSKFGLLKHQYVSLFSCMSIDTLPNIFGTKALHCMALYHHTMLSGKA